MRNPIIASSIYMISTTLVYFLYLHKYNTLSSDEMMGPPQELDPFSNGGYNKIDKKYNWNNQKKSINITNPSTKSSTDKIKEQTTDIESQLKSLKFYTKEGRAPIIIERYKLMWFINPKAASTSVLQLLAKMSNLNIDPLSITNYESLSLFKKLNDYNPTQSYEFLTSKQWKRVIILRDPLERTLSAYLGKAIQKRKNIDGWYFKKQCCDMWYHTKYCFQHNFTFEEFIQVTNRCYDRHWRPQYELVDDWKYINYVIDFKHLANATKRLLLALHDYGDGDNTTTVTNMWKEYGETGWGKYRNSSLFRENTLHSSNAMERMNRYYTPTLIMIVQERYSDDYRILCKHFPKNYCERKKENKTLQDFREFSQALEQLPSSKSHFESFDT